MIFSFVKALLFVLGTHFIFCSTAFAANAFDGLASCEGLLHSDNDNDNETEDVDQFSRIQEALKSAKIYSTDQLSQTRMKFAMGLFENAELMQGDFEVLPEEDAHNFQSPRNSIAVYMFDQLLGARMNVAPAMPYTYKGQSGVLVLKPMVRPGKISGTRVGSKTMKFNLRIFDYLINKHMRSTDDLIPSGQRSYVIANNADAFDYAHEPKPERATNTRDTRGIRYAWDGASEELKRKILLLDEEAVRDELSDYLSPIQLDQLWMRVEHLRQAVRRTR